SQLTQRFGNRRMFDRAGDKMAGRVAAQAEQGQVVGLGRATCEDNFIWECVEKGSNSFAGVFEGLPGAATELMRAGGVAVNVGQVGPQGFPDGRQKRSSRAVVEVKEVHDAGTGQGTG